MSADEHIAKSVLIGHTVISRLVKKYCIEDKELINEIQHQAELAYLTAIRDVHLTLAAKYPKNPANA